MKTPPDPLPSLSEDSLASVILIVLDRITMFLTNMKLWWKAATPKSLLFSSPLWPWLFCVCSSCVPLSLPGPRCPSLSVNWIYVLHCCLDRKLCWQCCNFLSWCPWVVDTSKMTTLDLLEISSFINENQPEWKKLFRPPSPPPLGWFQVIFAQKHKRQTCWCPSLVDFKITTFFQCLRNKRFPWNIYNIWHTSKKYLENLWMFYIGAPADLC